MQARTMMETTRAPFIACGNRMSRRRAPARAAGPPQATPEDGLAMPRLRESPVLCHSGCLRVLPRLRGFTFRATFKRIRCAEMLFGLRGLAPQAANRGISVELNWAFATPHPFRTRKHVARSSFLRSENRQRSPQTISAHAAVLCCSLLVHVDQ